LDDAGELLLHDRREVRRPKGRCVTRLSLAALGLALLVRSAQPEPLPGGAALDLCAFRATFVEDFKSLSASRNPEDHQRWFAHTPWGGDFGDAAFTDPRPGFPFTLRELSPRNSHSTRIAS
jgi:hypothetical protein